MRCLSGVTLRSIAIFPLLLDSVTIQLSARTREGTAMIPRKLMLPQVCNLIWSLVEMIKKWNKVLSAV